MAADNSTRTRKPIADRFWAKVQKSGPEACWLWTGSTINKGYGHLRVGGRADGTITAHRLSWELAFGPIPDGMWVLHRCDNPPCVRPDHLFLGTILENNRDCHSKGRFVGNPRGRQPIVPADVVRAIRAAYPSTSLGALARRYSLSKAHVSKIARRQSRHDVE